MERGRGPIRATGQCRIGMRAGVRSKIWPELKPPWASVCADMTAESTIQARGPVRVIHLACIALLLGLPFALYPQFVSGENVLYGWDSGQSHLARFRVMTQALQVEGQWPLWQTVSYGGGPFHANPENPTLYPPVLLLTCFLPPLLAMNLTILLHLGLAAVGMYLCTWTFWMRMRTSPMLGIAGSMLAAVFFGLGLHVRLETFNLVGYGAAYALAPWILLALESVLVGARPRRAAGALALLMACQVATGGLYVYAYTFLALALWVLARGLLGEAQARRRTLKWLLPAGLAVLLMVLAKALPFFDWVESTSRDSGLRENLARGTPLGGRSGSFVFSDLLKDIGQRTNGYLVAVLAPLALLLERRGAARSVLFLALLGIVAAAGFLHPILLDHLPPFDRIRGAKRAWVLAAIFLPLASGLGLNALLALLWKRRRSVWAELGLGLLLAGACIPFLLRSGQYQGVLDHPLSIDACLKLYKNWPVAAKAMGEDGRVMSFSVQAGGTRNEQFIASALGAESPAGHFGTAFPEAIAAHVYSRGGPLEKSLRIKRAKVMSVGRILDAPKQPNREWGPDRREPYPPGIDGQRIISVADTRPRAMLPARVLGVLGEGRGSREVLYAIFDSESFDPARDSVIALDEQAKVGSEELLAMDALVLVESDSVRSADWGQRLLAEGIQAERVERLDAELSNAERQQIDAWLRGLDAHSTRTREAAEFERLNSSQVYVQRASAQQGRFVVISETWPLYGGWELLAEGRKLNLHLADGVASAVFLRPGEQTLEANYKPISVRIGFWLAALGLALALWLCWGERSPEPEHGGIPRAA